MKRARSFLLSGAVTALIMTSLSFFIVDPVQAKGTLVSGLIAAITIAAIPIYNIHHWSLLKRSALHFIAMTLTTLPILLWSGWFNSVVTVCIFLLFGLAGWLIGYATSKR